MQPMTTLVTGATGHLGGLITRHLRDRLPAGELAVSVRDTGRAAGLAAAGIDVRHGDFDDPATLAGAFAGVDTLVLVSTDGPDELRVGQHAAAVRAAADAGVRFVAYTSITEADTSRVGLAAVHRETERAIRATGIPYAFLRNNMYHQNYTPQLAGALERGVLATATGTGRIASASRDDYALAAAVVAADPGNHRNAVYELTGPAAWSFDEFAATAAELSGRPLAHAAVGPDEYRAILTSAGLPPFVVDRLVVLDTDIARGDLAEVRPDLEKLTGRPATPVAEAIRAALA
jgi:NAD(P)H dehydrogenase (quinone)